MSCDEYFEIIRGLADDAPWFGLGEYEPTLRRKPPRRASSDPDYIRRVLISWLIGRPVSDIAERAGCSPRFVYSVISQTVYESEDIDALDSWIELGLVAVVDGPLVPANAIWGEDELEDEIDPDESILLCLVCHRIAGRIYLGHEERLFDGRLLNPGDPALDTEGVEIGTIRGHPVCHLLLEGDPIRFREPDPLGGLAALISPSEIARNAKERIDTFERLRRRPSWSTWVEPEVLRVVASWEDEGAPELLPVVDGRPMRRERARRWRGHMLDGAATNPGEDANDLT